MFGQYVNTTTCTAANEVAVFETICICDAMYVGTVYTYTTHQMSCLIMKDDVMQGRSYHFRSEGDNNQ